MVQKRYVTFLLLAEILKQFVLKTFFQVSAIDCFFLAQLFLLSTSILKIVLLSMIQESQYWAMNDSISARRCLTFNSFTLTRDYVFKLLYRGGTFFLACKTRKFYKKLYISSSENLREAYKEAYILRKILPCTSLAAVKFKETEDVSKMYQSLFSNFSVWPLNKRRKIDCHNGLCYSFIERLIASWYREKEKGPDKQQSVRTSRTNSECKD